MNLYEVVFWSSTSPDSPDSHKDTIYLVCAADFKTAIEFTACNASPADHGGKRFPKAHVVYEIGADLSLNGETEPNVLRGPYFLTAYNCGWKAWYRQINGTEFADEWKKEAPGETTS